jgi:3-dehydroquinate dehydratase/shikimate dehydrogenase
MFAAGADIAKVAVTPSDAADSAPLLDLPKFFPGKNVIAIGMGEFGLITRVAPGIVGAWGTFGRLDAQGSAPGQLPVAELASRYRVKTQSPATKIYAVLGDPVAHSIGPALHNAAMQAVGHDGIYLPLRMKDVVRSVTALRGNLAGCSITIPHKETALEIADSQDADVQAMGAANTFVFSGGRISATNTDAPAIRSVLAAAIGNLSQARVLILGAGGVARAAIGALKGHVSSITIANRTLARAEELGRHFAITAIPLDQALTTDHDILINCTSVGMGDPKNSPWPQEAHRPGRVVFDTVYVPMETRLLREAKAAGATHVSGLEMFLAQAAAQFSLWTGAQAPLSIMRSEAIKVLSARQG